MTPAISLQNVFVSYGTHCVLHDVSLACDQGEILLLIGPNGGGKTTLLRVIAGLEAPEKGTVNLFGMSPVAYAAKQGIGYVPQKISAIEAGIPASVEDILESACSLHCKGGLEHREHQEQIIKDLQLQGLLKRPLSALSGGERQKVFIARAFLSGSKLLLLDEPTTGVDHASQQGLQSVLLLLKNRGVTIVLVSHDPDAFASLATQTFCIDETAEREEVGAHSSHIPHSHAH